MFWHYLLWSFIVALIITMITNADTTVVLHRCKTHGSLKLRAFALWLGVCWIWMTTSIVVPEWVAVHRKHHKFSDHEDPHDPNRKDPHSPHLEGLWNIIWHNVRYYRNATHDPMIVPTYARSLIRDQTWWDRKVFNRGWLGPIFGTSLLCVLFALRWGWIGVPFAFVAVVLHAFMYIGLNSLVNGLCHYPHRTGYQHSKMPHATLTYNNVLIALLTFGEGYHHNHHWKARSARLNARWYEIDLGAALIWVLEKLGIAYDVKRAVWNDQGLPELV